MAFANRVMLVKHRGDKIVICADSVTPERESWLYGTMLALASVRRGLKEATAWKFETKVLDLDAARALADRLRND